MMQSELLPPFWPYLNVINSPLDQFEYNDVNMGSSDFSSPFMASDEFSETSSFPFATMFSGDFEQLADCDHLLQVTSSVEEFPMDFGGFEPNYLIGEIEGMYACLERSEGSTLPSQQFSIEGNDVWSPNSLMTSEASSMDVTSIQQSLTLPQEEMEIDNELSIRHLLKAYGEAMEMGQRELEEVILRCLSEKVNPLGQSLERLAFNLCQEIDDQQGDYLKQESCKNFEAALNLFYQSFPYGRFAHYAANTAILEAIPEDAETVHIVDFDMGEGVQLSQLIEAVAQRHKTLKVTAIKWDVEETEDGAPPQWRFEETKRQLQHHARSFGLNLKVEEIAIEDLVSEVKKANKRGGGREFLAFNCMVGLPHMRRRRSRGLILEFLRLAKDLLSSSANYKTSNRGIITFGDGDAGAKLGNSSSFSSFFDGYLAHYQALLESIESNFPSHLAEARMVIELMFVAPYVSSQALFQKWNEVREECHLQPWFGLEGKRLSRESLMEAKEMVGESSYGVRIGQNGNEMALEWEGTPLVRVSTWTNQS
ncbi:nodulation-signaling pathway 2 protein-like [Prunus avium]|uniref:Nodulation-signaling pathway 2 protein-like n=1 Tax=Prunus avium TaxID=42229 RepID=A0A6P5TGY8_PRUAV|nr:nodulation-signaling pathway 2 protein-like [Prunus avium]